MFTLHVVLYIAGGLSLSSTQTLCGASSLLRSYVLLSILICPQFTFPRDADVNDAKRKGIEVNVVTVFMVLVERCKEDSRRTALGTMINIVQDER
jgi:hypothetical protein